MGDRNAYVLTTWCRNQAHCQCGWAGKRRLFRGRAVLDVVEHCQEFGHMPVGTQALEPTTPTRHRPTAMGESA